MQGEMLRPMTTNDTNGATLPSTAPAISKQFVHHMQSVLPASTDDFEELSNADFVLPLLSMVGHVPVQVMLLHARVQFTEIVEEATAKGALSSLTDRMKLARSAVISHLVQDHPKHEKDAFNALQTVLQEQQHTAATLASAGVNVHACWDSEMRFYAQHDGSFTCQCLGMTVQVREEHMNQSSDTVLVTTDITKAARRAFFGAFCGGPGVLVLDGVAGTGKTETCRDICDMLGMSHVVLSGKELPEGTAYWEQVAKQANVIIIDEANRATGSAVQAAVRCAREAHVPLCLTCNSGFEGKICDLHEVLDGQYRSVQMLVPATPPILSCMLACEGFQQADDLGDRLCGFFESMKGNCTKQPYYDWGLRKMKVVTRAAGCLAREGHVLDERQIITTALQATCATSMTPLDQKVVFQGILGHFGAEAFVPMQMPTDFWNATATKISTTLGIRHGALCLPVLETEERFILAVTEEEAKKAGADMFCMSGTMAAMSENGIFGSLDAATGEWTDGIFTQSLRDMVERDRPGWLVVFCGKGKLGPEKWSPLGSLLDDNKQLRLASGETICLKPQDRIIFAAPSLDAPPATVSRLGIINLEVHHRHRM